MLNNTYIDLLGQKKLDALVAIRLHGTRLRHLQKINRVIELLSIAVPAFYITPRFLAKGTSIANFVDSFGEVLAGALLLLAIIKLVYKLQDDEIQTANMLRRNRDIVYESDRLLQSPDANGETVQQFLRRVQDFDDKDTGLLINIKKVDKQKAYRDALKEFAPSTVTCCPVCGANPWRFTPGNCDACGSTPVKRSTN